MPGARVSLPSYHPSIAQVRISCAGIVDILRPERHRPLQQLQAYGKSRGPIEYL